MKKMIPEDRKRVDESIQLTGIFTNLSFMDS